MDDLISRQAAIDACIRVQEYHAYDEIEEIKALPSAQPEITDKQAIEHLQESGWMQNHDKQMYEMGLREQLADDSDSYDALLPSAQSEQKAGKTLAEEVERIKREITDIFTEQMSVQTGYWTVKEGETAFWDICSECGEKTLHQMPYYKYCPYCGKRMKVY